MTNSLEFPYRLRRKIVLILLALFATCLICIAGLAYIGYAGGFTQSDATIRTGVAITFGLLVVLLIPVLLFRAQRGMLRLTDSELTTGKAATLAIRDIHKIDVRQVDKFRTMYVSSADQRCVMVSESMLPSPQAFDEIQQALLRT